MAENLPDLAEDLQIQEAEQTPNGMNPKKPLPRPIISNLPKTEDNNPWKQKQRKHTLLSRLNSLHMEDSSPKTLEARRTWKDIFKAWKRTAICELHSLWKCHSRMRSQDTLTWRKSKKMCYQQAFCERMAEGSHLNRKKMIKEGFLEHQEGRKDNGLLLCSFWITLDCWSKNYISVSCPRVVWGSISVITL